MAALVRSRLAVQLAWNRRIDTLCAAALKRSVYAFRGPTSHQRFDPDDSKAVLMGDFHQLWIPNFAEEDIWVDFYARPRDGARCVRTPTSAVGIFPLLR